MSAECYWCKTGTATGSVNKPIGTKGEPIGCCLKCGVLSCGDHSDRSLTKQEFKCFDCLFIILVASALHGSTKALNALKDLDEATYSAVMNSKEKDQLFNSVEEFKLSHPKYAQLETNVDLNDSVPINLITKNLQTKPRQLLTAGALVISEILSKNKPDLIDAFRKNLIQSLSNEE